MAGPEPSEIYCAAAMCFSKKYLEDVVSGGIVDLVGKFFPEAEKEAKANIVYPGNKNDILDLFKDIDIIDDTLPDNISPSGIGMKMQMLLLECLQELALELDHFIHNLMNHGLLIHLD